MRISARVRGPHTIRVLRDFMSRTNSFQRNRTALFAFCLILILAPQWRNAQRGNAQDTPSGVILDSQLSDRRLQRVYDSASALLQRRDFVNALPLLQSILDHPRDALYFTNPENRDQAISLKGKVLDTLHQLAPSERKQYDLLYNAAAQEVLQKAEQTADSMLLEEVVRRYYFTSTGAQGARNLAELYFDRGNSLAAALMFQRLLDENRISRNDRPGILLQTAIALRMAGLNHECLKSLSQLKRESTNQTFELGGRQISFDQNNSTNLAWLDEIASLSTTDQRHSGLANWAMFGGDATRNATSDAPPPLREQEWEFRTIPLSESDDPRQLELVESELRGLSKRFESTNYLQIPAMHPLIVGDTVVFRSLGNLKAIHKLTGEFLWETFAYDSEFMSLVAQMRTADLRREDEITELQRYIMQRTWRDMTSGTLSSNGELIFAIEEQGLLKPARPVNSHREQNYNKLMAYELASGKAVWELGGPTENRAGVQFLGPPLVQGNLLYCLISRNEEILLIALKNRELANGRKIVEWLWEQPLPTPISSELSQQMPLWKLTGLTPSYANGVLICPIAHETVIGYDLARGIFSWQFRYTDELSHSKKTMDKLYHFQSDYGISPADEDRWLDTAPIIAEGRVILTPSDSTEIFCLSLSQGTPYWSAPREDDLYVACVHNRQVILAGRQQIRARDLVTGREIWSVEISQPSGRGYSSEGFYYVPLSTAAIAVINLEDGTLQSTIPSQFDRIPGNLVAADGVVVSQTNDRIFRYFTQTEIEEQQNGNDREAQILNGELALLEGDSSTAIQKLLTAYEDQTDLRLHEILVTSLLQGLRENFEEYQVHVDLLKTMTQGTEKTSQLEEILATGLAQSGKRLEAFHHFITLIEKDHFLLNQRRTRIRSDVWTRAQLESLYQNAEADTKKQMQSTLAAFIERLLMQNDSKQIASATTILQNLPGAQKLIKHRMAQLDPYTESLELQQLLLIAEQSAEESLRCEAVARHYRLLMKLQRVEQAARLREVLLTEFRDVVCLEGMTGADLAEWGLENRLLNEYLVNRHHPWTGRPITVTASSNGSMLPVLHQIPVEGNPGLWEGWSFCLSTDRPPRFYAIDEFGEKRFDLALTMVQQTPGSILADRKIYFHGHMAVLVFSDQFYVFDLFQEGDDCLLHGPHDLKEPLIGFRSRSPQSAILTERTLATNGHPAQQIRDMFDEPIGMIAHLNSEMIVFQRDRKLISIDWQNGELLWSREIGAHGQSLWGTNQFIASLPLNGRSVKVFRTIDGASLEEFSLSGDRRLMATQGQYLIVQEKVREAADTVDRWELSVYDPLTQQKVWSKATEETLLMQTCEPGMVGILEQRQQQFRLLQVKDGTEQYAVKIETAPRDLEEKDQANDLQIEAFFLSRLQNGYLLNILEHRSPEDNFSVATANEFHFPEVHGEVISISDEGKTRWRKRINHQAFDPDQPVSSPVVVFLAKRRQRQQRFVSTPQETSIDVLNLKTGESIYNQTITKHFSRLMTLAQPQKEMVILFDSRNSFLLNFGESTPKPTENSK
jgi:outer membrane protein assembly factor BamB